jgi:hypothetical protein
MRVVLFVSLVLASAAGSAQNSDQRLEAAGQALAEARAQGEANAVRPGDEDLSCEALQAEMVAIAQSPEMQGLGGFAPQGQAELAAVQEAQAAAEEAARSRPRMFRQMVQGAATGVVPGLGRGAAAAQQAAAAAQAAQTAAQTSANLERVAAIGEQAALVAGPAMRGQRVIELAQARNCAWIQEGGMPPPGAAPAGGVPPGTPAPPAAPAPQR